MRGISELTDNENETFRLQSKSHSLQERPNRIRQASRMRSTQFDNHVPFEDETRTESLLRTPSAPTLVHHFGSIRVDLSGASVTRNGLPIHLSAQEFRLLGYFVRHSGVALSRDQLLRDVWGYGVDALTRTLDVHVANLRQKLEIDRKRPNLIRTVRSVGYKFEPVKQLL